LLYNKSFLQYTYVAELIGDFNEKDFFGLLLAASSNEKSIVQKLPITVSLLSINGSLLLESNFSNGKLNTTKYIHNASKTEKQSLIKSQSSNAKNLELQSCKSWFWVTTYYVDGVVVDVIRTLLYTTCGTPSVGGGGEAAAPCGTFNLRVGSAKEIQPNCGGNSGYQTDQNLEIEPVLFFEDRENLDLIALFKCFNGINSDGASYSIEIHSDLPFDLDPFSLIDPTFRNRVGHAFITLTKSNQGNSISRSFGFYPAATTISFATF
jgi:hypothetical protein